MNETITETLTTCEVVCSQCIDDLYHMAYLTLVDADKAEELITKICVTDFHKCGNADY